MATSRMSKSWADYTPEREMRDEETKNGEGNRVEIEVVEQFPEMTTANNPIKSKRLNSVPHKVSHKLKSCEAAIDEIKNLHNILNDLLSLEESSNEHNLKHHDDFYKHRKSSLVSETKSVLSSESERKKLADAMKPVVSKEILSLKEEYIKRKYDDYSLVENKYIANRRELVINWNGLQDRLTEAKSAALSHLQKKTIGF